MEFIVKTTLELSEAERRGLLALFNRVFEKERTVNEFENQYLQNPLGYCYHSLIIDNGKIVGAHTAFPSYYWFGDKKVKAYITGDTMVDKPYRDGFCFLDMIKTLDTRLKEEDFAFGFGFPNDKSYPVFKKARLSKDIGRLDTYILPYRIGGIKKGLSILNPISKMTSWILYWIMSKRASEQVHVSFIHKDAETYNKTRYRRMDSDYCHVTYNGSEFYYKIKTYHDVRTAFLIDVVEKSESNFSKAVGYILKNEKTNFDLLIYVGHPEPVIKKIGLMKVPRKYEPKHFYFTGAVMAKRVNPNLFFDVNNWDVNLSDYDII